MSVETPVIGIAGFKNAGKTTLVVRLVGELTRRGYNVATVKHAHHAFEIDQPDTDSYRHREAGARAVAVISSRRMAIIREFVDESEEPPLAAVLAALPPADIVVVEGYKRESIPKIEARRRDAVDAEPLAPGDPAIIAIASDHETDGDGRPVFALDDVAAIADFLVERFSLGPGAPRAAPGGASAR